MHTNDVLLGEKIDNLQSRFNTFEKNMGDLIEVAPTLVEMVRTWDAALVGKRFLAGMAVIITSVAAIGAAAFTFFSWLRHGY